LSLGRWAKRGKKQTKEVSGGKKKGAGDVLGVRDETAGFEPRRRIDRGNQEIFLSRGKGSSFRQNGEVKRGERKRVCRPFTRGEKKGSTQL